MISLYNAGFFHCGLHRFLYIRTFHIQYCMPGDKNEVPSCGKKMLHLAVTFFHEPPCAISLYTLSNFFARKKCFSVVRQLIFSIKNHDVFSSRRLFFSVHVGKIFIFSEHIGSSHSITSWLLSSVKRPRAAVLMPKESSFFSIFFFSVLFSRSSYSSFYGIHVPCFSVFSLVDKSSSFSPLLSAFCL